MSTLRSLTLTTWYQTAAVGVMTLVAGALAPTRWLAVLVGGAVMVANFWALRYFAARALLGAQPKRAAAVALALKLVVVAALMAFCILVLRLDVLGFAVGMSSLFVGVLLAMIHQAFSPTTANASSGSAR